MFLWSQSIPDYNRSLINLISIIITLLSLIICHSLQSSAYPEQSHEKCFSKSNANDINLSCESRDLIAIFEAFFTTSVRHRCGASSLGTSTDSSLTDRNNDIENENKFYFPPIPSACTDDIRLSLNRRCSGVSNCSFNLLKDHIPRCIGEDGSVIIRYTCVSVNQFHPYCNVNFTSSYGYVSTPGYPKYYPPYEDCKWHIEAGVGQVVQIDLLDVAIREPLSKPTSNPKKWNYQCLDKLVLKEENTNVLSLCGEVNTNLVQFRTKSNRLTIEFNAIEFSPTRGLLFRYSLQNCPTLPAPKNGHLIGRNGSFAYYSCCLDHVFKDTKEVDRVLYCEFGNHWNSSVSKCVPKELSMSSSLILSNDSNVLYSRTETEEESERNYISDILIPVLLMVALLVGNAVIVWVLFKLKRKQKTEAKNRESNVPLNSGSAVQTNV